MRSNLATLRSHVELSLAGRIVSPFGYRDRKSVETVLTGIPEIDALAGGLPRGALTEICGPPCSGARPCCWRLWLPEPPRRRCAR